MERVTFNSKIDNIFEFGFMDDFTTVILAKEEYEIDIANVEYQSEDDFYCFSEQKAYSYKELYRKFNICLVA